MNPQPNTARAAILAAVHELGPTVPIRRIVEACMFNGHKERTVVNLIGVLVKERALEKYGWKNVRFPVDAPTRSAKPAPQPPPEPPPSGAISWPEATRGCYAQDLEDNWRAVCCGYRRV